MPGLRDILLVLLVVAAVYLVIMLIKLTRVGQRRESPDQPSLSPPSLPAEKTAEAVISSPPRSTEPVISPANALAAYTDEDAEAGEAPAREAVAVPPAPTFEWDDVKDLFGEEAATAAPARPLRAPAEPPRQGGFGEALADHLARSDMESELQRMRNEMEQMRKEMEEMRSARRVSPQYAEAMELVQRGSTAQDVADRLGISLAEAELVYALSRSPQNFDEGDPYGAERNTGGVAPLGGRPAG